MEKRSHKRLLVGGDVFLSEYTIPLIDMEFVSELINISETGALIRTEHYFEPGTLLKLKIRLSGWDRFLPVTYKLDRVDFKEPLITIGEVLRVEMVSNAAYIVAVRFDAIDDLHQRSLGSFIDVSIK